MENGMVPSGDVIIEMCLGNSKKYEYLMYITAKGEIESFVKPDNYTLAEYK